MTTERQEQVTEDELKVTEQTTDPRPREISVSLIPQIRAHDAPGRKQTSCPA